MIKNTILLIGLLATVQFSCSKDPLNDLSTEESIVYITNQDKAADFRTYKTFSIVDSVQVVENNRTGTSLTDIDRDLLNGIIGEMQKLGYSYVSPTNKPDIGINAAWITNTYLNVATVPSSYWGGYGYGGYGYGYPNYYQYYETSESYWSISMLDFKNPNTSNQTYNVIWNAQIQGGGAGSRTYIDTMVKSIFAQSPYLKIN